MAMMHLLLECSFDSIIAEYRLLHELALLPSKNRVVQRNPLNLGCNSALSGSLTVNFPVFMPSCVRECKKFTQNQASVRKAYYKQATIVNRSLM